MAYRPSVNTTCSKRSYLDCTSNTKQIPMRLFEDYECEQSKILVETRHIIPQNNIWNSFSPSKHTTEFFPVTPPMTKKTITVPNAPMKPRKALIKTELKPKKLIYAEKYKDVSQKIDSGICIESEYVTADADLQQPEFSKRNLKSTGKLKGKSNTETLGTMLKNVNLEKSNKKNKKYSTGKEYQERKLRNDRPIVKKHSTNSTGNIGSSSHSSKLKYGPVKGFNRSSSVLSQSSDELDWQEILFWLQPRRDVGMMIQCCQKNCKKWRYTEDYHDPVDVPEEWYCKLNSDKTIASCLIPEIPNAEDVEEDLIENKYNAGSIVWGYMKGYPWWPAIVDDCPTTLRYYELQEPSITPVKYHVTFFTEDIQHAWLKCKNIKPFIKNKKDVLVKKTIFHGTDYKPQLEKAYASAQNVISLSILERLQNFSCVSRFRNKQDIVLNSESYDKINDASYNADEYVTSMIAEHDESSNEIIPASPSCHITLKDFYGSSRQSKRQIETSAEIINSIV